MSLGQELKYEGIARVAKNGHEFRELILPVARRLAEANGEVTSDELRDYADEEGIEPHHQNVWGSIFMGSEWQLICYRPSKRPSNRHRKIGVYRLSHSLPTKPCGGRSGGLKKNGMDTVRMRAKEAAKTGGGIGACPYVNTPHRTVWIDAFSSTAQMEMPL